MSGSAVLSVAGVSSAEQYSEGPVGELSDALGRNTGGLFVKVGCREFPDHHYKRFAPEVRCRKFLA